MSTLQKWVVCEKSGRWAAALRVAFARSLETQSPPRLYEVRMLGELSTHLDEHGCDLVLIEVGRENLADVLQLLIHRGPRFAPFVALSEMGVDQQNPSVAIGDEPRTQPVADLLSEVGAADVVESPRQLRGLLALHKRLAAACGTTHGGFAESHSFADWAWSTLPWQDP